jgi:hypothetical protein
MQLQDGHEDFPPWARSRAGSGHSRQYSERMLHIRQRVADHFYDSPPVLADVARRILESGDIS